MYTTAGFQPQSLGVLPTGFPAFSTRAGIISSVQSGVTGNVIQGLPQTNKPARQLPAWLQGFASFLQSKQAQQRQNNIAVAGQVQSIFAPVVQSGVGGLQIPFPLPNGVHSRN